MRRPPPRPTPPQPRTSGGSRRVVVFGEVLCDLFAPTSGLIAAAPHLVPRLGGAPANVAVQLARLGVPTSLITATGADPFGVRLHDELKREGVDTSALATRPLRRTGVTLVEVDDDGERRFYGFRENSADLSLDVADTERPAAKKAMRGAAILHTGTVSLRSPSSRRATRALQKTARAGGALVSLDVNLRPGMFPSLPILLRLANAAIGAADVVKATREEAQALCGKRSSDKVLVEGLLARGPRLVLLTFGDEGCLLATRKSSVRLRPVHDTRTVDATGAGDAFVGAVLAWLFKRQTTRVQLDALRVDELKDMGLEAGIAGAAVVTAMGATTAMLSRATLDARVSAMSA
ncbi:MAG: carbohydrate kinase [Deltaproteobacteria bacterium]|nr:carbohydrate kinase [Deltaproteobacteria bacterium]